MGNTIAQKSVLDKLYRGIVMIIIGDYFIPYENIETINCVEDISLTQSNSTIVFDFDKDIMVYCMKNDLSYAVKITNITQAIYANSMGAKYIISLDKIIESVQKIAENYLFDSKIMAIINGEDEIEQYAIKGIDGVIFQSSL